MINRRRPISVRRILALLVATPVLASIASAGNGANQLDAMSLPVDSLGPVSVAGLSVKNFGVVDRRILRGSQPREGDYAALAAIGVSTIIDLREDAKSDSRRLAAEAGLAYINIPMKGSGGTPNDDQARRFISAVEGAGDQKVYVHCAGGRHRTGSMIAIYRMTHQGWTVDRAFEEMLAYDFYTGNGHGGFKTYVFEFAKRMAVDPANVPGRVHTAHVA